MKNIEVNKKYKVRWVDIDDVDSNYGKAVNVEVIEDAENIRNKVHYCLKDCRDQGTDFTEIIDFANSDFLKEEL